MDTPDVIVLPDPMEPSVPAPDNTKLGRAVKWKFDEAREHLDDENLRKPATELSYLCKKRGAN